ncbi:MAG: hypothetical protein WBE13_04885, partial [Candidatus Acidiferrum sp.]
ARMDDGSTVSLVFIPKSEDVVFVAILGDSPVLVYDANGDLRISPMHNARSNEAELKAAKARGAGFDGNYIFAHFSSGGIQMTRVLGDRELSSVVNREPEIYAVKVGSSSIVIVGTDGLFDPTHRNVAPEATIVAELVRDSRYSAADIVRMAELKPTHDNVTAIVVRFGNKKSRRKFKVKKASA